MADAGQPYQVMPDLDGEEFDRLKADIAENGIEYPIILDGDGEIIDGHHRYEAWVDLGRDPDDIPTRVVDDTDDENYHRAYRANLLRRDLSDGTKREVVKQYLLEHPARVAEDTQQAIAEDLGVGRKTVSRAVDDLEESGKLGHLTELSTEEKRAEVREYVEDNPDASNREVAREVDCDVTHVTVGNWREEWDIQEPTTELDTFTNSKAEADKALDVVDKATDDDTDEEVRETAAAKADEIASGETTPDDAAFEVERAQDDADQQQHEADQRETFEALDTSDVITIAHTDFREYDGDLSSVDHIITDPPYDTDAIELWDALGKLASETLPDDGFLIAYSGKANLPAVLDTLGDHLNYYWTGIVHHDGAGAKIFSRKLRTNYKPIVVFQRGDLSPQSDFVSDVVAGGGREKDDHEWQQAEAEAAGLIERFTDPNDTILDPMCGSGTTGVAALRAQRRAILLDRDADVVTTAKRRVADES
jgi:16S rRNA G966 N2-methylase RsmD/DNA-binding MarR family transcriptional regulator